ncbi:glycosyltransferase family 4 protein [Thalassorhabdomicrobium marinisediminis]|uniref:Glycosyltransferase subfamily 4-like N-terminal domain-containing protein n=1 Tax=Thalassorhabdomicrobium marinisediminis TaxID=2170577 RepID=A0A2T7FY41_9RHOB|nr:glycosyltransferase [Thalassorhabdomicrobium marinisediminis]PVA07083.1 hypothetical protein DC363_08070 [Thalassorhabdomicrobium marinisediminis]
MPKSLKITFVSRKWPPAMGGMETYSERLCSHLQAHSEVEVIALPGHADGSTPRLWELVWFGVKTAFSLFFRRQAAPVIHVADMASWPLALAARLRRPFARCILSAHGTDVAFPARGGIAGRLYGAYLRLGANLLGEVTVVANSAATAAAAARFRYRDIVVVPLAAEARLEGTVPEMAEQTILFSGRLVERKGCRWFIETVLPHLPERIALEVAGTIWCDEEGKALDTPRVRYLGRLDQAALYRHMAAAMCVIVPNIELENGEFEGFGLVAVEAAAVGGVVVAARHAGLQEAVQDGETGFLVAPGDAARWIELITDIAGWTPEKRAKFTERARTAAADYYNWDRVARDTVRHYAGERAGP